MFKIIKKRAPNYLTDIIPRREQIIRTKNNHIPIFHCRIDYFKFPWFKFWFKLDDNMRNSESVKIF